MDLQVTQYTGGFRYGSASLSVSFAEVSPAIFPDEHSLIHAHNVPYGEWLAKLPYYVCEDLLNVWIDIIEPKIDYSVDTKPTWWPEAISFAKPRELLKKGRDHHLYIDFSAN